MRLIKQPLLIGYILTGILVGPIFGLVENADALEGFSKIGIALLLFLVGLGLNPKVIKELGKTAVLTGITQVGLSVILGTAIMLVIGRSLTEGLIVGVALAFSSTIVGLKLLTDKREQTRLYGRIAIGVLLVQDVIATLALLVLSVQSKGFSFGSVSGLLVKGGLITAGLFLVSNKLLPRFTKFFSGSAEFLFLFAIAWGFGIAALFEWAGFSLEIGALIAGVSLASMPYALEASSRLKPVRDFFIVIFFVFLGANLKLGDIFNQLPLAILFSVMILVSNPLAIMLPLRKLGHTRRNSFKVGIMMAQISEFSLIFAILALNSGIISQPTVSMLTITALITIAASCYAIIYDDEIFNWLSSRFDMFKPKLNEKGLEPPKHYDIVQFGYRKGGAELIKAFKSLKRHRMVVVDYDPEILEILERRKVPFLYGDATDIELLDEIGITSAKIIVTNLSSFKTNQFLVEFIETHNPDAVVIAQADSAEHAAELYGLGASYVMVPHFVGSERLGNFIARHGYDKKEYEKNRERHLTQLRNHYALESPDEAEAGASA